MSGRTVNLFYRAVFLGMRGGVSLLSGWLLHPAIAFDRNFLELI
ncbi:MAG: hypothetical protein AAFO06_20345 [Cyanobacteria bacterium J06597_16]